MPNRTDDRPEQHVIERALVDAVIWAVAFVIFAFMTIFAAILGERKKC